MFCKIRTPSALDICYDGSLMNGLQVIHPALLYSMRPLHILLGNSMLLMKILKRTQPNFPAILLTTLMNRLFLPGMSSCTTLRPRGWVLSTPSTGSEEVSHTQSPPGSPMDRATSWVSLLDMRYSFSA
jgi:hypothetical protein